MKPKKLIKKLSLKKVTVSYLDDGTLKGLKGGTGGTETFYITCPKFCYSEPC